MVCQGCVTLGGEFAIVRWRGELPRSRSRSVVYASPKFAESISCARKWPLSVRAECLAGGGRSLLPHFPLLLTQATRIIRMSTRHLQQRHSTTQFQCPGLVLRWQVSFGEHPLS